MLTLSAPTELAPPGRELLAALCPVELGPSLESGESAVGGGSFPGRGASDHAGDARRRRPRARRTGAPSPRGRALGGGPGRRRAGRFSTRARCPRTASPPWPPRWSRRFASERAAPRSFSTATAPSSKTPVISPTPTRYACCRARPRPSDGSTAPASPRSWSPISPALRGGCSTSRPYQAVARRLETLLAAGGARLDADYHCPHHPDFTGTVRVPQARSLALSSCRRRPRARPGPFLVGGRPASATSCPRSISAAVAS